MDKTGNSTSPLQNNVSMYLAENSSRIDDLEKNLDTFFIIIMAIIISFMQCGFAFLEAGSVRSKNTTNILLKNLLDTFIGCFVYWSIGYSIAFGEGNFFIGWTGWFGTFPAEERVMWFFQFVFAATACTIVSGSVAERCEIVSYFIYSIMITGVVYPVVARWVWHKDGWLRTGDVIFPGYPYQDFAGSSTVHLCGGVVALWGAVFCGPRLGRFDRDGNHDLQGHSIPLAALGAFILLFGFFAFNGGSQLHVSKSGDSVAIATAIFNTVIAGTGGAISSLVFTKYAGVIAEKKYGELAAPSRWSILQTINGALVGMVAVCAGCNLMASWAAFVVGIVGAVVYLLITLMMTKLKIDDPLEAVAVHGGGGLSGTLLAPLLINPPDRMSKHLLVNIIGASAIVVWTSAWGILIFATMKKLKVLRVSEEMEVKGMDEIKHGEPAYPVSAWKDGWSEFGKKSIRKLVRQASNRSAAHKLIASMFYNAELPSPEEGGDGADASTKASFNQEMRASSTVTVAAVTPADADLDDEKITSLDSSSISKRSTPSPSEDRSGAGGRGNGGFEIC